MEAEQGTTLPRIGLVATDELRIEGLRAILTEACGWELVLLSQPRVLDMCELELVLIDANATEHLTSLLEGFRKLRPSIRLLVLGGSNRVEFIEEAITAGARGVLSHEATESELRMAVDVVRDGSVWAPRKVLSRLLDRANKLPVAPVEVHLTKREIEVLRLLMLGLSNREIADSLSVEQVTVKAHLGRLMRKAGVGNRTALGMRARESKWA